MTEVIAPELLECPEAGCRRAWLLKPADGAEVDPVVRHLQLSHRYTELGALERLAAR